MKKRGINFGLIALGTLFLFNPKIAVIDILPDFLGYFLIMAGIDRTAMMNAQMNRAKYGFLRLSAVSAAELIFTLFIFVIAGADERGGLMLVGAFAVGFFECVFVFAPWNNFCDGLIYSGYRDPLNKKGGDSDRIAEICRATKAFFVFRAVITLLPELSMLTIDKGSDRYYKFISLFRFFSVSICAIVGVIWLIRILIFLRRTSKQEFVGNLAEKFTSEILPQRGLFIRRRIRIGFALIGIGAVFGIDLVSDAVNLTPDVIGAAFMIAGLAVLRPYVRRWLPAMLSAAVWGATSVVYWIVNYNFIGEHSEYLAASKNENAYFAYRAVGAWGIAEAAAFLAAVFAVCAVTYLCIGDHAGFSMKMENGHGEARIAEIRRSLRIGLYIAFAAAILCAASQIMLAITQPRAMDSFFEAMPVIKFASELIFAVLFCRALGSVRREIEYKYMLS